MWLSLVKWLAPVVVVFGLLYYAYTKGVQNTDQKWKLREATEEIRRANEATKVVNDGRQFKDKVRKSRTTRPIDDRRDSCLLTSQTPKDECSKYLQPGM